ncbi:MAG: fatty acid oxidation complex subunit alpha FadB [Bdellovibrionaceae bacterium]|jgi:3-hydroxyacyl-CoA dehydrogenase / enoyl-CoA hydratase / 3-hydroxybutyryl-CoA epimerase / enoyl-CoA isomerase|nr:fatty acid oxidation complex subunit alpha FadB [Pseudobdellovibrionaceae bacterium]
MLYDGKSIQCEFMDNDIIKVNFNSKDGKVNKFDARTIKEISEVLSTVRDNPKTKGLIFTSSKEHFIMGADINEFLGLFKTPQEEMTQWLLDVDKTFNGFEDLDIPTVTAINGYALGGGFELCLTTDLRIASKKAKIGLPETQLGILPGWGGTVRLSRLCGPDNAIEWITSGKQYKAEDGFTIGAIDAVVEPEQLEEQAIILLKRAINNEVQWKNNRKAKTNPIHFSMAESMMSFEASKGFVAGIAGPNYPAPVKAIDVMQKGSTLSREDAQKIEAAAFAELTHTKTAESLVQVYLGTQYLKSVSKKLTKDSSNIDHAAVLGAGIMGGGIAYQSASKGTPITMKDINHGALELGLNEATSLLGKLVKRNKINATKMAHTLNSITPTLSYGDFNGINIVIEAVIENEKIKKSVLAEVEEHTSKDTILASNTSTISINALASDLKRPENFCGMHFFNPVHKMPLVEVIKGDKTSAKTIATTVAYAQKMGKTPIVVNDCPGFLVNRVLFPYFGGFLKLVNDGVDFVRIDKVMEKFGWPMGPAYLLDVVGVDTAHHASAVMAEGFPDRMKESERTALDVLFEKKTYGQKTKSGFYEYALDRRGRLKKSFNKEVMKDISSVYTQTLEISDEEIIERMMLPMVFECSRCLEDNIVDTAIEVDMGLLYGLGFPPFRTGALKYADDFGIDKLVTVAEKYSNLGKLYEPTAQIKTMAKDSKSYY